MSNESRTLTLLCYLEATSTQDADTTLAKVTISKSPSGPPWLGFVTTPCAWALFLNHFAANYQTYTLLNYLPKVA